MPETFVVAVIDDDNSFRMALAEALPTFGVQVLEYASAAEFLAGNGHRLSDLVVTDVHMPGMSGLDLAARLAASDWKVPILLITARSDAEFGGEGRGRRDSRSSQKTVRNQRFDEIHRGHIGSLNAKLWRVFEMAIVEIGRHAR